jgi:hypothetical protein
MTKPISPIELDAISLIEHAAKLGCPFEDYLKSVARNARVKVKKISEGLKNFEDIKTIN